MARKCLERTLNKSNDEVSIKNAVFSSVHTKDDFIWSNEVIFPKILNNLNSNDKIQLSTVSKSLRLRLESSIFREIKLLPDDYLKNPTEYGRNHNIIGIRSKLCDVAIEILENKSHLIKEIVINEEINAKFAKAFFKTFCNIISVKVEEVNIKISTLTEILKPLKQLEHLFVESSIVEWDIPENDAKLNFRLPYTIKSVKVNRYMYNMYGLNPILTMTDNHSNLQCMTLMHDEVLNNFKKSWPNLVDLTIFNNLSMDMNNASQILINNPQITSLEILQESMTESLLNLILSLNLATLKLALSEPIEEYNLSKLATNCSINRIELSNSYCDAYLKLFLQKCKNVQSLKLSCSNCFMEPINFNSYSGPLKFIQLHEFMCDNVSFDDWINCQSLDQITFTEIFPEDREALMEKLDQLKYWKVTKGDYIILDRLTL